MKKLKSSTDHFTGRERQALHGIRRQLAQSLQPLLVLYLGSLATTTVRRHLSAVENNATDFRLSCELLVVLPAGAPLHGDRQALRRLEGALSAHGDVRLLVRTPEGLARELAAGYPGRLSVHSHAIVLYERDHALQQIVQRVQAEADAAKARRKAAGALRSARSDGDASRRNGGAAMTGGGYLPVGLSEEERADPLQVVTAFYREYDLPEVRERIGRWLSAVSGAPSWPVAETGLHLDFYLSVCRLLSCAWLLRERPSPSWVQQDLSALAETAMPPRQLYCPHADADDWDYFPHHLSRAEFASPGLVFAGLFAHRALSGWLSELYELFTYSLTDCTPAAVGVTHDLPGMAQALHRLAEACHLLVVWERRAGEQSAANAQQPGVYTAQPVQDRAGVEPAAAIAIPLQKTEAPAAMPAVMAALTSLGSFGPQRT